LPVFFNDLQPALCRFTETIDLKPFRYSRPPSLVERAVEELRVTVWVALCTIQVREIKQARRPSGLENGCGILAPEERFHLSVKGRESVTLFFAFGVSLIRGHNSQHTE